MSHVEKPGRYVGGELNQVVKEDRRRPHRAVFSRRLRSRDEPHRACASCTIASTSIRASLPSAAIAPWPDCEAVLRETETPLWTLETHRPLKAVDIVGFSLQYELSYPNVLTS